MKPLLFSLLLVAVSLSDVHAQNSPIAIKFFLGDSVVNQADGVPLMKATALSIRVVPNHREASDVKYAINWKIYLRSGSKLGIPYQGTGEFLRSIPTLESRPGDVISLEILRVTRTDASGNRKDMPLPASIKYLSIAVRK